MYDEIRMICERAAKEASRRTQIRDIQRTYELLCEVGDLEKDEIIKRIAEKYRKSVKYINFAVKRK